MIWYCLYCVLYAGVDLLSPLGVSSALEVLTSEFGMVSGVAPPPLTPAYSTQKLVNKRFINTKFTSQYQYSRIKIYVSIGHEKFNGSLVYLGSTHYCAYTVYLSTRSSFWDLMGKPNLVQGFVLEMLSALIHSKHSYPAVPQARQPVHQRFVHPGPLVLGMTSLKFPTRPHRI